MGWIISVGQAGTKGRTTNAQAMNIYVDLQGAAARVQVFAAHGASGSRGGATSLPAHQAQRVWQNVLSTLVGA